MLGLHKHYIDMVLTGQLHNPRQEDSNPWVALRDHLRVQFPTKEAQHATHFDLFLPSSTWRTRCTVVNRPIFGGAAPGGRLRAGAAHGQGQTGSGSGCVFPAAGDGRCLDGFSMPGMGSFFFSIIV